MQITLDIVNPEDADILLQSAKRLGCKVKHQHQFVDATKHLFINKANKNRLLQAKENVEKGENLVEVSLEKMTILS